MHFIERSEVLLSKKLLENTANILMEQSHNNSNPECPLKLPILKQINTSGLQCLVSNCVFDLVLRGLLHLSLCSLFLVHPHWVTLTSPTEKEVLETREHLYKHFIVVRLVVN